MFETYVSLFTVRLALASQPVPKFPNVFLEIVLKVMPLFVSIIWCRL